MLKPESAHNLLNIGVYLGLVYGVFAVLAGVGFFVVALFGNLETFFDFPVPVNVSVKSGKQVVMKITELSQGVSASPISLWDFLVIAVLTAALGLGLFMAFRRAGTFINRVVSDPFHPTNATDLLLAARVALLWQAFVLVSGGMSWWSSRGFDEAAAIQKIFGDKAADLTFQSSFSLSNYGFTLTPLWIALALAILASVFRRAHDLRESERRLRQEQELTV